MKKTPIGVFFHSGIFHRELSKKSRRDFFGALRSSVSVFHISIAGKNRRFFTALSQSDKARVRVAKYGSFIRCPLRDFSGALRSSTFGFSPGIERKKPERVFRRVAQQRGVRVLLIIILSSLGAPACFLHRAALFIIVRVDNICYNRIDTRQA